MPKKSLKETKKTHWARQKKLIRELDAYCLKRFGAIPKRIVIKVDAAFKRRQKELIKFLKDLKKAEKQSSKCKMIFGPSKLPKDL